VPGYQFSRDLADLGQQLRRREREVQRTADDLDARMPYDMPGRIGIAPGVDETPARQVQRGAVGQYLVEARIGVAARLLLLVLGVDNRSGAAVQLPHQVGSHPYRVRFVEVAGLSTIGYPAIPGGQLFG
jgi:hypothetical protein